MNYSFEYIDIILLAMIAGFIFLRLRGILGKRTGFEGKTPSQLKEVLKNINVEQPMKSSEIFDRSAQDEFLKGAKIAYETIITDFSDNDNQITTSKPLINNDIYYKFNEALKTALGMSFISMVSMEIAMNVTDVILTGGAMLTWWVVPIMLFVGFITPWPYNYWRLKKYNIACH